MLRVAVPNKGSLSEPATQMLREAGYRQRRHGSELVLPDPDNDVEFFFLRPRDIATYVATGTLEVGITGRDVLFDGGQGGTEILALGFGRATFRYAAVPGTVDDLSDLAGKRIATSYEGLVTHDLQQRGIEAEVIHLDGAVETAVRLGVADIVADVVETGTTLRQAGLEILGEPILDSEAILIQADQTGDDERVEQLVRRINGVIIARQYVIMDYDCRIEHLERACAITPGLESPTVSPLHEDGWVAVRAMVLQDRTNQVMDELWQLGARGIFVTDILACRL